MKKAGIRLISFLFAVVFSASLVGCSDPREAIEGTVSSAVEEIQKKVIGDNTLKVESVSEDRYVYQTLDEETKEVYDELVYSFENREEKVQIATTDVDVMQRAYNAVRADYCNFFWVGQMSYVAYTRNDKVTAIEITPEYSMSKSEQDQIQSEIDAEVQMILANAPMDGTDYDKALYVYETLIDTVDYVTGAENNQNIISVFLNHETVCQGYAYATQYLLEQMGIQCTTVSGTVEGGAHAWNLVKLDGDYYYIDTTWGNSQYVDRAEYEESGDTASLSKYIDYDYFCADSATILQSHTPGDDFELPECTATADNYYVHEGLYVSEWNPDQIGAIMQTAYEAGEPMVQVKFSDMELCEQALQYFIEDMHLTDYCRGLETISYMENTDDDVLFLIFIS